MLAEDKQKLSLDEDTWQCNVYFQRDNTMFMQFMQFLMQYKNSCERMLKKPKFQHLVQWLYQQMPFLSNRDYKPSDYGFSEIIHLVVNGMDSFPQCPQCGKSISSPKRFVQYGFMKGCSNECSMKTKACTFKSTCLGKYGVEHYAQDKDAYKHYCDVLEQHHGVRNSFQLESSKKQIKKTKKDRYGNENYVNVEKARTTRHHQFDGKWEDDVAKERRKTSFTKHYGIDNNMKSAKGLKEYEDSIEKKYGKGIRNISQAESVKQKKTKTCKRNFGVEYPQQSSIVQKKTQKKCLQKYGYASAIQSPTVRRKAKSKYFYNNIFFDSAPELAYYIWLKDNNISFEYHPNVSFKYEHGGRTYIYQPDFKVGNKLIEIKGDHFFKEDGTMQNPYDHTADDAAEAKHQCMLKNNVKILRYQQYIEYIKYVTIEYGASYLKQFKCISKVNKKQDEECSKREARDKD